MFRRVIGLSASVSVPLIAAPVAFADDRIKNIYDDSVEPNLPGTNVSPEHADNALSKLDSRLEDKLKAETVIANGLTLNYNQELKNYVKIAREQVEDGYNKAYTMTQNAATSLFNGERSLTNTISGLRSPDEHMLPASIYILVAALSGSVISRPRNIVVRAAAPLVFGTAAFAYFLPKTYSNTTGLVYSIEKKHAPALADAQDAAATKFDQAKKETASAVQQSESSLKKGVHWSINTIERWTGLDFSGRANK